MNNSLRILLVVLAVFLIITVLRLLSQNKLPVKYSLFWLAAAIIVLLVGIFPNFIGLFTNIFGFQTTSSLVTGIIIGLLLLITLLLTIIVSEQKRKMILLVQEISLLKEKIDK